MPRPPSCSTSPRVTSRSTECKQFFANKAKNHPHSGWFFISGHFFLFAAGEKPYLSLHLKKGEDVLKAAQKLVEEYAAEEDTPTNSL